MSRQSQKILVTLFVALIGGLTTGNAISKSAHTTSPARVSPVVATEWYPVTKVVDGDTLDVRIKNSTIRVRLIGLNTPESVDPRRPVQCFGKEASAEMKKIVGGQGQAVRLETDPTQNTYDKYGRLLAYVYVPANTDPRGILVNQYMIAEGYGHEYTYDLPYKFQKQFKVAERSARDSQKGLWAAGVCTQ